MVTKQLAAVMALLSLSEAASVFCERQVSLSAGWEALEIWYAPVLLSAEETMMRYWLSRSSTMFSEPAESSERGRPSIERTATMGVKSWLVTATVSVPVPSVGDR